MRIKVPAQYCVSLALISQLLLATAIYAGSVEYYNGVVEKGNIILDAKQIRLRKYGCDTVNIIQNENARFVELAGIKYSYDANSNTWIVCDRNSPGSIDDSHQTETISFWAFKAPNMTAGEKVVTAALDSVFFMNFYEVKYLGYNYELTKEFNCFQSEETETCGFSYSYPDVPYSGLRNLIAGCCLLTVGLMSLGTALNLNVDPGVGVSFVFFAAAGVQFTIRGVRNREYNEWKRQD